MAPLGYQLHKRAKWNQPFSAKKKATVYRLNLISSDIFAISCLSVQYAKFEVRQIFLTQHKAVLLQFVSAKLSINGILTSIFLLEHM